MTQALTEATLAGMTLEEIQAHARYSEESTNAVVETLFKALLEARAGIGERDAVDALISNLDALAQLVGARFVPDPEKVERYRRSLLRSPSTEKARP
jgi:hypothetical protein